MSTLHPLHALTAVALASVLVAFSSSTQDVALDAFRIESAAPELQGAMSAAYILATAWRFWWRVRGALYSRIRQLELGLSDHGGADAGGILAILWADEPKRLSRAERNIQEYSLIDQVMGRPMHMAQRSFTQRWLIGAVICPVLEFFSAMAGLRC